MGKIVKFCAKCEEGFAEKFGFCPNCGENLEAFEMNPVEQETAQAASVEQPTEENFVSEPLPPTMEITSDEPVIELDSVDVPEEKSYEASPAAEIAAPAYVSENELGDDDYCPTVIEEKDVQLRNGLLISLGCLVVSATMIAWVVSIFVHTLQVDALGDKELFAFVAEIEDKPVPTEEEKKKDEGKGGGGGGKERERDASKGEYPNQAQTPSKYISPMEQRNFDLKQVNVTQGPPTNIQLKSPTGIPNGLDGELSSGPGRGGGIGGGEGGGVGGGKGGGNEGYNGGRGGGNRGGAGGNDDDDDVPAIKVGVTSPVKILAKQQAKYTDPARQNNVQGTVTLRVTFTANGTIGSIAPVSGLPYGLTEQAIAAARQIRFEPAKKNGVPYTTSKTVSFTFTIY